MTIPHLRLPAAALALLATGALAACDGSNAFRTPTGPGGTTGKDQTVPTVDVQFPTASAAVLVGDSVFTQVRVHDDKALASVQISGFSVRGNPNLGTAQRVDRFATKTVDLTAAGRTVTDTVVARYLIATADTVPETQVYVVATARDTAGNTSADTTLISIQGRNVQKPTVRITFPADSATVAIGDSLFTQFRVTDGLGVAGVRVEGFVLRGDPSLGTQTRVSRFVTKTIDLTGVGHAVRDTTLTRYLLSAADSVPEHGVLLVVTATNASGQVSADTVAVNIGGPRVTLVSPLQGATFAAGTSIPVHLTAADRFDLVSSVRVRATGAFTADTTLTLRIPAATVDTTILLLVPASASGAATLDATTTSGARIVGQARPVGIIISATSVDRTPPRVSFSVATQPRAEVTDSFGVTVTGTDETRVDSVGTTVKVSYRNAAGHDTVATLSQRVAASTGTFKFALASLGLSTLDTASVTIDVTAFAKDGAANCGAAVTPNSVQSLPCVAGAGGAVGTGGPGAQSTFLVVRGLTVAARTGDLFADLVSDGRLVFASNFNQNRVEVLPVTAQAFGTPISVGSQPWGLAIGRTGDSLYVANSGGTNISVVGLALAPYVETRRIRTPDATLFDVAYDVPTDTVKTVTMLDYSDRPQFLGQVSTGQLIYSTKPTPTRSDGTVRIYDAAKDTTYALNRGPEIFTSYADLKQSKAVGVNALSVTPFAGGKIQVCPRRVSPLGTDPACVLNFVSLVSDSLTRLRAAGLTDTRLDLGVEAGSIGLSDTTFVATSRDHSTIAFGEGVRDPGRILLFKVTGSGLVGSNRETADLVGNAAERVIGLGLNQDGSLGVARGSQVYFFESVLRLQGVVQSGSPAGGAALHPENTAYPASDGKRIGFASGIDATTGAPYVDVIDTYSFRSLRRVFTRDVVTGTLIAIPVAPGDPEAATVALRLFALTRTGVVRISLRASDMQ
ncbi:MAG: hypothetical protein JWM27_230 [Gemmatimonadetes bacterium]|nr:hypothetical protein [Gemmatimonadota bacterium]